MQAEENCLTRLKLKSNALTRKGETSNFVHCLCNPNLIDAYQPIKIWSTGKTVMASLIRLCHFLVSWSKLKTNILLCFLFPNIQRTRAGQCLVQTCQRGKIVISIHPEMNYPSSKLQTLCVQNLSYSIIWDRRAGEIGLPFFWWYRFQTMKFQYYLAKSKHAYGMR